MAFVSQIKPKIVDEAINDEDWYLSRKEELNQFTRNNVFELITKASANQVIVTQWLFRNNHDEDRNVLRKKAKFIEKVYNKQEGVYFFMKIMPMWLN